MHLFSLKGDPFSLHKWELHWAITLLEIVTGIKKGTIPSGIKHI